MDTNTQPRQPSGTPVGGQFAGKSNPECDIELVEPVPDEPRDPVSFGHLERGDRVEAMQKEIAETIERMSDHEGWTAFLDSVSQFHQYSFGNTMLILSQKKDATCVAGFHDWKNKFGRTVKKGEKGIWILAPMIKKVDTEKDSSKKVDRLVGFRTVAVFDVSQTEGPPLPEPPHIAVSSMDDGEAPPGMVESLSAAIEAQGFTIERGTTGEAGGYTQFQSKKVVISDKSNDRQAARTLAHEAAHIVLGHGERSHEYHTGAGGARPDMEVEAESVAYIVGKSWGIEEAGSYSFGYIDSWARGDAKKVRATADAVVKGARALLGTMDQAGEIAANAA
jgi:antirestriction protein ArdC